MKKRIAVLPLRKTATLRERARALCRMLVEAGASCSYDDVGPIGSRYQRYAGYWCATVDCGDDGKCCLRHPETKQQQRVSFWQLKEEFGDED